MYTKELYKSVAVNERSVTGNEDSSEEFKRENSEVEMRGKLDPERMPWNSRRLEPEVDID